MSDRNDDIKVYQDKKTKAEDYKSSAYTLLFVGVIGMIALVLMMAGVLPFRFAGAGRFITYGAMGALFAVFIVMGISSFLEAVQEDDLTGRIKAWAKSHLTADAIRRNTWSEAGTPDEMKYFQYFEAIKTAVTQEFGGMNASYLDALCEELYADLFEEQ